MKKVLAVLFVGALLAAGPVSASTLHISFTGLNLAYDGSAIYDAGGANSTRPGNSSSADRLASMDFFVDGTQVGHYAAADNIFADIYIPGVTNIPVTGGMRMSTGPFPSFGFDLFIGPTILALQVDSPFQITWNTGDISILGSASTTSIQGQALPFGLTLGTPVTMAFDVFAGDYGTTAEQTVSRFTALGSGDVRGPVSTIPEPATLMLLGFGLLGGGAMSAKRRRK